MLEYKEAAPGGYKHPRCFHKPGPSFCGRSTACIYFVTKFIGEHRRNAALGGRARSEAGKFAENRPRYWLFRDGGLSLATNRIGHTGGAALKDIARHNFPSESTLLASLTTDSKISRGPHFCSLLSALFAVAERVTGSSMKRRRKAEIGGGTKKKNPGRRTWRRRSKRIEDEETREHGVRNVREKVYSLRVSLVRCLSAVSPPLFCGSFFWNVRYSRRTPAL